MRYLNKNGKLDPLRQSKLEEIGFEWVVAKKSDTIKFSVVWDKSFQVRLFSLFVLICVDRYLCYVCLSQFSNSLISLPTFLYLVRSPGTQGLQGYEWSC